MNASPTPITLSQARAIAEKYARDTLQAFSGAVSSVLKDEHLESDYCWMFFKHDDIDVPPEATLGIKWAHVVSKKGTYSMVQDLSTDKEALHEYLQKLSQNFEKRGE